MSTAPRKPRPKTGEKRATKQPLKIDKLPPAVHQSICTLYNEFGRTWEEIEELSALPIDTKNPAHGGFVPWDELPTHVLELFPDMRLPHSSLHRWYDIRIDQVQSDVLARAAQARELAQAFAKAGVAGSELAVTNAARDVILGMLSENSSEGGRINAAKGLLKLAEIQQKVRTNDIRERKTAVEEQTLQIKLDEIKRRTEKLLAAVEGGEAGAPVQLTREQLLEQVRGIYGIA